MGNALLFPHTPCTYQANQLSNVFWIPESIGALSHPGEISLQGLKHDHSVKFPVQFFPAKSQNGGKSVLLYFHGNSCDLGDMATEMESINNFVECHIVHFEFPGYGVCTLPGMTPDPPRIDLWGRAVAFLLLFLGVSPTSLILYGRSIGTGPAAKVARVLTQLGFVPGGIILHAPFESVHSVVKDYASLMGTFFVTNWWDTRENLKPPAHQKVPLLIIQGENDEVIPVRHGKALFDTYFVPAECKEAMFPADSTHNAYYVIDDLAIPIRRFLVNKAVSRFGVPQTIVFPSVFASIPRKYLNLDTQGPPLPLHKKPPGTQPVYVPLMGGVPPVVDTQSRKRVGSATQESGRRSDRREQPPITPPSGALVSLLFCSGCAKHRPDPWSSPESYKGSPGAPMIDVSPNDVVE